MRSRSWRRAASIAAAAALGLALGASSASALQVTVTGDDNAPVTLGGPVVIRNMSPTVAVAPAADEQLYVNATYTAPDGVAAASAMNCTRGGTRALDYRGNGSYAVTVQRFTDSACRQPLGASLVYAFTLSAGVTLSAPGGRVLIREPNSYSTTAIVVRAAPSPGALSHDVRYALGGVIGTSGAISGASEAAYLNTSSGTVPLNITVPGRYTVVARARGWTTATGQYFSPWSAPVHVRAVSPFDLESIRFADGTGPSYEITVQVRERTARGKVFVSYARGYRGGRYRSLGSSRLSSSALFTKRFTLHRTGIYRLRFRFEGSGTTASGTVIETMRIKRTIYGF